jgi:hypothetical protein
MVPMFYRNLAATAMEFSAIALYKGSTGGCKITYFSNLGLGSRESMNGYAGFVQGDTGDPVKA